MPLACAGTESEVLLAPPFTLVPVVRFDVLPPIVYVTTKFAAISLPELFKVTATVLSLPLHVPCAAVTVGENSSLPEKIPVPQPAPSVLLELENSWLVSVSVSADSS